MFYSFSSINCLLLGFECFIFKFWGFVFKFWLLRFHFWLLRFLLLSASFSNFDCVVFSLKSGLRFRVLSAPCLSVRYLVLPIRPYLLWHIPLSLSPAVLTATFQEFQITPLVTASVSGRVFLFYRVLSPLFPDLHCIWSVLLGGKRCINSGTW